MGQCSNPHLSYAEEKEILESQPVQTEAGAQTHHGLLIIGVDVTNFDSSPHQNRVDNETFLVS